MSLLEASYAVDKPSSPSPFHTMTVVAIVLAGISILWSFADSRMVGDAAVWMKPLKFALSFALLFATISLVEARLSQQVRTGWAMQIVAWIMAAAFLSEMMYMMYQAARGEASHFNFSTPFNEFMYTVVMAGGAVALVACTGAIGWLALRDKQADFGPSLRQGIWLGFLLSFVLTMIVAGYMSGQSGHYVGLHPQGAPTLPLVGWSGVVGDLRPAHFLSLHAMQALPLLGLWLDRRGSQNGINTIRLAAVGYAAVTFAVFAQAVLGLPLIPLG